MHCPSLVQESIFATCAWLIAVSAIGCGSADNADATAPATTPASKSDEPGQKKQILSNKIEDIVSIEFAKDEYTFALDEVSKGVQFDYKIVVGKDVPNVVSLPQDVGRADGAGPSGLFPFEEVSGNGQSYSLRDVGLAPPTIDATRTIKKGTHPLSFVWDGRNWNGPSDFCPPKGDPFPPGDYSLGVRLVGNIKSADETRRYEIVKNVKVTIEP
jgi:hypothetical protein